jgi:hypothetical protein
MIPPPIMTRDSGMESNESAPVDETTVFSSNGRFGKGIASEPVAMMMFLV